VGCVCEEQQWAVKGELQRRSGDAVPNEEVQFSGTLHGRLDTEQDPPHGFALAASPVKLCCASNNNTALHMQCQCYCCRAGAGAGAGAGAAGATAASRLQSQDDTLRGRFVHGAPRPLLSGTGDASMASKQALSLRASPISFAAAPSLRQETSVVGQPRGPPAWRSWALYR
jgi:hypothetical protein